MNWNQTGMPVALVGQLGRKRELAEFKSVLNDAQNQILRTMDVETMAQDLMAAGGRDLVEMVRGLTTSLANARKELEDANRRYERLTADLAQRGISLEDRREPSPDVFQAKKSPSREPPSPLDGQAEWEEWDRRFRSLLG